MDRNYTISEILEKRLMPVTKRQIMELLTQGKKKQEWTLPDGYNYLLGINVGNGLRRARWAVPQSEIDAWIERSRSRAKNAANPPETWPNKG